MPMHMESPSLIEEMSWIISAAPDDKHFMPDMHTSNINR